MSSGINGRRVLIKQYSYIPLSSYFMNSTLISCADFPLQKMDLKKIFNTSFHQTVILAAAEEVALSPFET